MPEASSEKKHKFYLNGEPVDKIPGWALDKMSERLSFVVSRYFSQHPEEYEKYLNSPEHQAYLKEREVRMQNERNGKDGGVESSYQAS